MQPQFLLILYFQRRRSATVKVSVRAERVRPHSRGAAEEEGGVGGEGADHDLGRDDVHHGHARHRDGKLLQRWGYNLTRNRVTLVLVYLGWVGLDFDVPPSA